MLKFVLLMLMVTGVAAQPAPQQIVAQTGLPNPHRITLLSESCGWPGGAMRVQLITPGQHVIWGCWGYNQTGVQIQWQTSAHTWIDYAELWAWDGDFLRQMGYQTLHRRVLFLRNGQ